MPNGIKINVTREIIDNSIKGSSSHCMIADAIKEHLDWAKSVSVDLQSIRMSNSKKRERLFYITPRKAQMAIIAFDQGEVVEPFIITLSTPHRVSMKVAARSNIKRKSKPTIKTNSRSKETKGHGHNVEETVGRAWPTVKIGRRRQFGLRALDR